MIKTIVRPTCDECGSYFEATFDPVNEKAGRHIPPEWLSVRFDVATIGGPQIGGILPGHAVCVTTGNSTIEVCSVRCLKKSLDKLSALAVSAAEKFHEMMCEHHVPFSVLYPGNKK